MKTLANMIKIPTSLNEFRYVSGFNGKLRLVIFTFVSGFFTFVSVSLRLFRRRFRFVELAFLRIQRQLFGGIVANIDGLKYELTDKESFHIISWKFESWMWKYMNIKEDDIFVDVGAHIGKYSLRIAKKAKFVLALEPFLKNFLALTHGIEMNGLTNVLALNLAAWSESGRMKLYSHELYVAQSLKRNRDMSLGYVDVFAVTLDELLQKFSIQPSLMKIDVEGAEYEVLRGSIKVLTKFKPRVVIEVTENKEKVLELMEELGYNVIPIKGSDGSYYYFHPKMTSYEQICQ